MRYATLLVSVLILVAVLIPGRNLPDVSIGGYDKLVHIIMFIAWGVAVRFDFDERPFPFVRFFLFGILFSSFTELVQILVEGRSFDIYDMAADVLGLLIGLLISRPIVQMLGRFGLRR